MTNLRISNGLRILGIGGIALLLGAVFVSSEIFSASITGVFQPIQNSSSDGSLKYTGDYSGVSAILTRHESSDLTIDGSDLVTDVTVQGTKLSGAVNVKVDLIDDTAGVLDTQTVAISTASGSYSQTATLTLGTIPYHDVATVLATYSSGSTDLQLFATEDTHADQKKPTTNYGTDTTMEVDPKTAAANRSFVLFDVSTIPAGSTVNTATLTLCATSGNSGRTHDAFRVTASWTETGVTWNAMPSVAASATASIAAPSTAGCVTWSIASDVQLWVDGTANYGWRITDAGEPQQGSNGIIYRTSEEAVVTTERPKLDVNYTAP